MTFWVWVFFSVFSVGHSTDYFKRAQKLDGKSYAYKGPNCFSTSLYFTKLSNVNTGVDLLEFESVLRIQCQKFERPLAGDIGVIKPPQGDSPIHSFVHIDENTIFEKQGVGEFQVIPLQINSYMNLHYRVVVPDYCRRYSSDDLSLCSNVVEYYRCTKLEVYEDLNDKIQKLKKTIFEWLDYKVKIDAEVFARVANEIDEAQIEVEKSDSEYKPHYLTQIVSLKKQMRYIELSEF